MNKMSKHQIYEKLTMGIFTGMNTRNMALIEEVISDDVVFNFPGTEQIEGAKKFVLFIRILLRKYKTLEFTINEMIFDNQSACLIWTNKGETLSGEDYKNSGVTLFHFKDEKICFLSDYFKDTSFIKN